MPVAARWATPARAGALPADHQHRGFSDGDDTRSGKAVWACPVGTPDIWRSFRSELDRLFDRFTSGFGMMPFPGLRYESSFSVPSPPVDIAENEGSFKLSAELPGMTEKDIQVSLSGDTLTIKGEKRQERQETKQDYHLTERSYGEFQRAFILPENVDGERIDAAFANGVLTVTVPKTAQAAPKKIEVKPAG